MPIQKTSEEGLKKAIGTWGLTANIINVVIGSGIFILPALVSEALGPSGIFAYIICSVLIALVMLCFAELGSKITLTGGAYTYIEKAFGKYAGFLTTNLFVFGAAVLAAAAIANAIADTLAYLWPVWNSQFFRIPFFIVLFSALTVINVRGIKQGIRLVVFTTLAKLIPILVLIVFGIMAVQPDNLKWDKMPDITAFGNISVILFFAFQGAENSLSVGGEVKNAKRTYPRAILLSFIVILIIYLLVQVVAQGVLGNSITAYKKAPLAEVARRTLGTAGVTLITAGAAISMFGYLCSDVMNMPRVLFRAAWDKVIPLPSLARVHSRFATPYLSVILFTFISCVLAIAGEFRQLAILSSSSVLLIYLGVALATIKLRTKEAQPDHFKIPGGVVVPLLATITIIWFLSNLSRKEVLAMGIFLAVLTLIYFFINMRHLKKNTQQEVD